MACAPALMLQIVSDLGDSEEDEDGPVVVEGVELPPDA